MLNAAHLTDCAVDRTGQSVGLLRHGPYASGEAAGKEVVEAMVFVQVFAFGIGQRNVVGPRKAVDKSASDEGDLAASQPAD